MNLKKHLNSTLFLFFIFTSIIYMQTPPMMWIRAEGGERNEYVYFRKDVTLNSSPTKAKINLYADSRYALYVNENYIGFGPARTFHEHPTYDTYDIAPYLKRGENTIAVKVLSNGMVTYQLFNYKGGFTAWGKIIDNENIIDLSVENNWKCKKSDGYDQTAPRFSFATGPIEILDTRADYGWNYFVNCTDDWQKPIEIKNQKLWGTLTPRTIPHLTQNEIVAEKILGTFSLNDSEDIYSFRIPTPDLTPKEYGNSYRALAYAYIYSPNDKEVTAGLWWGDFYLNGEKISKNKKQQNPSYREDYQLKLKKGWNLFVVKYGIIWGSWDFYIALPNSEGLILSASKDKNSGEIFYSYGPSKDLSDNIKIDSLDLSKSIEITKQNLSNKWIPQLRSKDANHPARDMVWKNVDKKSLVEIVTSDDGRLTIPISQTGTALIYDMGEIQLGRFFVEGDFPDGTIIDIGFSEELNSKGLPWLYKRYQIGSGHRFITSAKQKRYETFKPYGAKYLQLNISKNITPVTIKKIGMVRQVYPFEKVGSFKCSDTLLNRIWDAGWRTLQLCAEDSYTDTPFRERGLYAGDMLPEAAITMTVTGDTRLLNHSLRVFQDMYKDEMQIGKENVHSEFPLITLLTLDYVTQYSGDWNLAKEFYSNYKSLLKNHLTKKMESGLIKTENVFLEWTDINRENSAMTAFQAITVRSLNILASWAKHFEKYDDENYFLQEANKLREAINENLWDEKTGSYFDGIKNDTLINKHHLTSSVWSVLYGVTGSNKTSKVLKMLKDELVDIKIGPRVNKITPYSSFYLFAILYQQGKVELVENFMKEHWGPMALHSDKPTVWENFDIAGEQGTSSHAWSGHPTYFLTSEVLGVNLGFYKKLNPNIIEIEPQTETVDWAEGTVVHPAGKVFVSWKIIGDKLMLNYDAPKNIEVKVQPKGRLAKLKLILKNIE